MSGSPLPIGVFTGTRAEYGLFYPVLKGLQESGRFLPRLYVTGAHLDPKYGSTIEEIRQDGVPIAFQSELPELGRNMAADTGCITLALGRFFEEPANRPACMLVLGDRYETLGASVAAFLSNIPLAHLHGGDVVRGGMLDDPIRHAITKLAHLHFPATQASADRILAMGEEPWRVTVVGSPALDNIRNIPILEKQVFVDEYGLDPHKPWVLFTQHPITTQPELAGAQARQTLNALASFGEAIQVLATYPNHDEGSQAIIDELETRFKPLPQFRVVPSLGRIRYLNALRYVAAVVGNSSSGLLETAHFQVPCLNVGDRQEGRERGDNVLDVPQDEIAIQDSLQAVLFDPALRARLCNGRHPFGEGDCARRIVDVLSNTRFDRSLLQKQLTY